MSDQGGLLSEGFRRVWRYQRVLWWMFAVNFVLAFFGAMPAAKELHDVLDHSLRSQRLADMFDVGDFSALASNPKVKFFSGHGASLHFAIVFFVFALFLAGGILEAYRADRKLTTREFFEACGSYFWRLVRLTIFTGILLAPLLVAVSSLGSWAGLQELSASQESLGFWVLAGGCAGLGFLVLCIRLWFDVAQVRAVVEEEYGMLRNAGRAFRLTFSNFRSLFWMYFRISLLWWVVFVAGAYVWAKMPPSQFEWTILILELVVLWGFATRLWQRACEMTWYQRRLLSQVAAPAPVVPVPPDPLLGIAPAPPSETSSSG